MVSLRSLYQAVAIAATIVAFGLVGSHAASSDSNDHTLGQGETKSDNSTPKMEDELSVLFVLDPNCFLCYEEVGIDAFTNETLLPWVHGLKDAFTATTMNPQGNPLEVSLQFHSIMSILTFFFSLTPTFYYVYKDATSAFHTPFSRI